MSKIYKALKKVEMESEEVISPLTSENTKASPGEYDQRLITLVTPNSVAAEQFRKLKTSILKAGGNDKRCILITSAVASEGKTLISSNLAISIAYELQQHVLLVDADLRRPGLHEYFDVPNSPGLSEYLSDGIDLAQLFVKTPIPKLSILPAGTPTNKATELFASQKMMNLVQELKSRYQDRYIIIDSTPIMSTTEPDILSQQVDSIIFVVRAEKTPREVAQRALLHLDSNKDKIIGTVFNNGNVKIGSHYYGYYGYYDYYGKEKKKRS